MGAVDSGGNHVGSSIPLYVYVTSHAHSRTVCGAFAEGAHAPTVPTGMLRSGAVALYGRLRGCNEILKAAIEQERTWYYIDRGYFRATRDADYSGYFRVTKNALQHSGVSDTDADRTRWQALGLTLHEWRRGGKHILVCPPGDVYGRLSGFDSKAWTQSMLSLLRLHTDRPLRVREKPRDPAHKNVPLSEDLRDCWAMVAHSSNAAVEAVLMGVPVFCTDACAAFVMGKPDIREIEHPAYPSGREEWAAVLANNQWTLEEMRDGTCWRMLNGSQN